MYPYKKDYFIYVFCKCNFYQNGKTQNDKSDEMYVFKKCVKWNYKMFKFKKIFKLF